MPPVKRVVKKATSSDKEGLATKLQEMQQKFKDEIENDENILMNKAPGIIVKATEEVLKMMTSDLPDEFLNMPYKDFLSQMSNTSFANNSLNDTFTVFEHLHSKVKHGEASPATLKKYEDLKSSLKKI
uniref:Uncharacterized protein n=1 Tax=Parastrongyloides trichosuri TaxID=131310 RepID=A0A0N4ZY96_PARTI